MLYFSSINVLIITFNGVYCSSVFSNTDFNKEVLKPDKTYIIAPTNDTYQIQENVTVIGLTNFLKLEL